MTTTATAIGGFTLVALGVGTAVSFATSASQTVAAPVLTTKPASSTTSTAATFAWTGPSGATYQCSLDNASFAACTTPKTYSPVTVTAHTFQVKAISGSIQSTPTAYGWTVDQTPPPAPTFASKPTASSNVTSPSFAFADAESGVTYQCKLDPAVAFTACSNPATFSALAPGAHSLSVKAVDAAGNVSTTAASYPWSIDTIAPAAPVLTLKPNDPAVGATQTFMFSDSEVGVTFRCAAENGIFAPCSTPYSYIVDTSNSGQHQFGVQAVDAAGNVSAAASYTFKVTKDSSTSGTPFQITGSVSGLTIGEWQPVAVRVTNPNSNPIYVSALTFTVSADSTPTGCSSASNIETQQSNVSTSLQLVVPANGFVDLPAQGVLRPQMRLKDLSSNQDICKGKSFTLAFTGSAHN